METTRSDEGARHAIAKADDPAVSDLGDDMDAFALKGNRELSEGVAPVEPLRGGESRNLLSHLTNHAWVWRHRALPV